MKKLTLLLLLLFLYISGMYAQDLISAADAKKIVMSKNTVFVSVRPADDYARVHIVNAVNVPVSTLANEGEPEGILKTTDALAKILGEKGIDPAKKIVIYGTGSGKSSGRLYWILKYLGYPDVKIMDGHMKAWMGVRGKVTNAAANVKAASVTPKVDKSIFTDYAYVKSKMGSALLVDVRPPDETATGIIKGAIEFDFKKVLNAEMLKSKDELASVFKAAGITKDKEIILYCATSVRAGIVFLALKSVLEYPNVKIYEGAYNEWKTK